MGWAFPHQSLIKTLADSVDPELQAVLSHLVWMLGPVTGPTRVHIPAQISAPSGEVGTAEYIYNPSIMGGGETGRSLRIHPGRIDELLVREETLSQKIRWRASKESS